MNNVYFYSPEVTTTGIWVGFDTLTMETKMITNTVKQNMQKHTLPQLPISPDTQTPSVVSCMKAPFSSQK